MTDTAPAPTHPTPIAMRSALEQLRDELERMPESDVVATPGLDASRAIAIAMGSLARLREHRDAVARELGESRATALDRLPLVVYAAAQASFEVPRREPGRDLAAVGAEVAEEHGVLLADAGTLVRRRLLDAALVDQCRATLGYLTLVGSTVRLATLFRDHWPRISERTGTTLDDLARAEGKAQELVRLVTERRSKKRGRTPARELRARAMTELLRTYSEVRRMIAFVRHREGDVDVIVPSLWSQRRSARRGADARDPTTE